MKPLRRKQTAHITTDPATGRDRVLGWTQEQDVLSDQGSVDSVALQRQFFLDCGCSKPAHGRCFECGALSCEVHHGICHGCQKPICMQHSHMLDLDGKGPVRLCGGCHDKVSRKMTRAKVGRFFLSLIVRTGESDD